MVLLISSVVLIVLVSAAIVLVALSGRDPD